MGIVNLTDNSYFASSRCLGPSGEVDLGKALDRTERMLAEGADIIDIGACSTRPGSQGVGAEEEWRRLGPFLREVRRAFGDGVRISVDTYWASVVERCFDTVGPFMVNDISAGGDDPAMLPLVGRLGLEYVAMHKRGTPADMQSPASGNGFRTPDSGSPRLWSRTTGCWPAWTVSPPLAVRYSSACPARA